MPARLSPRQILDRLVAFPTVSRDSNLPLIDWVEDYLDSHGVTAQRVWNADRTKASLYAQIGPAVAGGVILSGHTDVVPVDGQPWSSDPWTVTERDGRLYGRGTCDMKGFVALALAAVPLALAADIKRPLQLALSHDEEVGCTGAPAMIAEMVRRLPRAAAVIVGEPSRFSVVTGHKGGTGFKVHVKGHEVHSSLLHTGVSAIMAAAPLIDFANRVNAANAARPPAALAQLFDPPWTTLHVGMVEGGTAHNITAADCRFSIEFRVVPGEDIEDRVAEFARQVARAVGTMQAIRPETGITLERFFSVPPLRPEAKGAAEALVRRLTGDNGIHVVSYGTEAGQFQAEGYSAVVCGPGDIAQAHQPDEYLELSQFNAGWSFMQRLVAVLT
ncbi:MAG: acetylornithine deacetylase [Rhodobacter sp.]